MLLASVHGLLRSITIAWETLAGRPVRRRTPDRDLLEHVILPAYACRPDVRRVLFVGCAPYTSHYDTIFERAEYWTIDPKAWRRRWGAVRHIPDRLEHLGAHVPIAYFDLIVCNGVLGWGLNEREDAERAFAACHRSLRTGGELVIGWNDVAPRNRVAPDVLRALMRFERSAFPLHGTARLRAEGAHRHVFDFYRKPDGGDAEHGDSVVGACGAVAHADSSLQRPSTHKS